MLTTRKSGVSPNGKEDVSTFPLHTLINMKKKRKEKKNRKEKREKNIIRLLIYFKSQLPDKFLKHVASLFSDESITCRVVSYPTPPLLLTHPLFSRSLLCGIILNSLLFSPSLSINLHLNTPYNQLLAARHGVDSQTRPAVALGSIDTLDDASRPCIFDILASNVL